MKVFRVQVIATVQRDDGVMDTQVLADVNPPDGFGEKNSIDLSYDRNVIPIYGEDGKLSGYKQSGPAKTQLVILDATNDGKEL